MIGMRNTAALLENVYHEFAMVGSLRSQIRDENLKLQKHALDSGEVLNLNVTACYFGIHLRDVGNLLQVFRTACDIGIRQIKRGSLTSTIF